MNKIDDVLIEDAKRYVTILLTTKLSEKYLFHSINHTLEVLKNAEIIASYLSQNEEDLKILRMSALFHDVGYIDSYDDHEIYSAQRACRYLRGKKVEKNTIDQIERAILSTRTPQYPLDQISRILCDADLMNLTFDDYFEQLDLMRKEWELVGKADFKSHQFHLNSLEFFQKHQYHSEYGKKILQPKKKRNELRIMSKVMIDK
jgi:putative nucleotidyltransferase with HDIG domain